MQWFAADGDGVGEAVKNGFKAGKDNYGQMLLLAILNFFIIVAGFLLLGIGLIVAYPVTLLAQAHMFRQCAGRNTLPQALSLIHISEPTRHFKRSRMPSSA